MKAQEFIIGKLDELKKPLPLMPPPRNQLENEIVRLILSKKFRKYSANEELIHHVRRAVHLSVQRNEPVNLTFFHGAYKLWRLEEAPNVDWAELFAMMYFSQWLKPVCAIYEPGVWLDIFVDDTILERLNNLDSSEIRDYIDSEQAAMDFLENYRPKNLRMTITPASSQFASVNEFWSKVEKELGKIRSSGLCKMTEADVRRIEMSVRPKEGELRNENWWQEKHELLNAYYIVADGLDYYEGREDKIMVLTRPLPGWSAVAVGTTKNSVMKFWIGAGVLTRRGETYEPTILSFNQLKNCEFDIEKVSISGLDGKNFERIRVLR